MPVYIRAIAASLTVASVLFLSALILASSWGIDRKLTYMATDLADARGGVPTVLKAKAVKTVSWDDLACHTRTVTTYQGDAESLKDFCARHDAMVAHDMQVYGVKKDDSNAPGASGETWLAWYLERNTAQVLQDRPGL